MENNKQQTGLDWYITKRHEIEIESRLGHLPPDEYDEELKKAERQAKEMEKERIENAFNSGYNNGGLDTCLTPKQYYEQTYGGGEQ
jgi:hypothetical protein